MRGKGRRHEAHAAGMGALRPAAPGTWHVVHCTAVGYAGQGTTGTAGPPATAGWAQLNACCTLLHRLPIGAASLPPCSATIVPGRKCRSQRPLLPPSPPEPHPQAKASAPGSITWWRRLRLEDTCLPELASFMPVPGLGCFIATLFMRYGEGPVPAREFKGLDAVLACLGGVEEVGGRKCWGQCMVLPRACGAGTRWGHAYDAWKEVRVRLGGVGRWPAEGVVVIVVVAASGLTVLWDQGSRGSGTARAGRTAGQAGGYGPVRPGDTGLIAAASRPRPLLPNDSATRCIASKPLPSPLDQLVLQSSPAFMSALPPAPARRRPAACRFGCGWSWTATSGQACRASWASCGACRWGAIGGVQDTLCALCVCGVLPLQRLNR